MSGTRVEVVEACDHGEERPHDAGCGHNCGLTPHGYQHGAHWWCPGGSRRTLTPGEYVLFEWVAAEGRWRVPDRIPGWDAANRVAFQHMLTDVLDALAGTDHGEGT